MTNNFADVILLPILPSVILLHLFVAPYTKVEESFNIQATHDILTYGCPPRDFKNTTTFQQQYDHFSFPGAVPRTSVGAHTLATVSGPIIAYLGQEYAQLVVRGILGLFNAFALYIYSSQLGKAFGRDVGRWYILLQASQFHVMFYASRTLPNMFAFGLSEFLRQHRRRIVVSKTCSYPRIGLLSTYEHQHLSESAKPKPWDPIVRIRRCCLPVRNCLATCSAAPASPRTVGDLATDDHHTGVNECCHSFGDFCSA